PWPGDSAPDVDLRSTDRDLWPPLCPCSFFGQFYAPGSDAVAAGVTGGCRMGESELCGQRCGGGRIAQSRIAQPTVTRIGLAIEQDDVVGVLRVEQCGPRRRKRARLAG